MHPTKTLSYNRRYAPPAYKRGSGNTGSTWKSPSLIRNHLPLPSPSPEPHVTTVRAPTPTPTSTFEIKMEDARRQGWTRPWLPPIGWIPGEPLVPMDEMRGDYIDDGRWSTSEESEYTTQPGSTTFDVANDDDVPDSSDNLSESPVPESDSSDSVRNSPPLSFRIPTATSRSVPTNYGSPPSLHHHPSSTIFPRSLDKMLELGQVPLDYDTLVPSAINDHGFRHSQLASPACIECALFKKMALSYGKCDA